MTTPERISDERLYDLFRVLVKRSAREEPPDQALIDASIACRELAAIRAVDCSFNAFLGQVQGRLIAQGFDPPNWPETIRDLGDLDGALDSCTEWCADRLRERAAPPSTGASAGMQVKISAALREVVDSLDADKPQTQPQDKP